MNLSAFILFSPSAYFTFWLLSHSPPVFHTCLTSSLIFGVVNSKDVRKNFWAFMEAGFFLGHLRTMRTLHMNKTCSHKCTCSCHIKGYLQLKQDLTPYFYSSRVKHLLEAETASKKRGDLYPTTTLHWHANSPWKLILQQQASLKSNNLTSPVCMSTRHKR